ncbi:hypothetical protein HPP92_002435 [Vanilla planifolia]|nr:hypothetical protein HPP92_002435 [Vanilla planifolia]
MEDSNTELDSPDGTYCGRSYDCIFCKRGFSTAQALGGHMNIHRKDRAQSRHPNRVYSFASLEAESCSRLRDHNPYANFPRFSFHSTPDFRKTYVCFPESTTGAQSLTTAVDGELGKGKLPELRRFGNELSLGLRGKGEEEGDVGLDLELRLGH